MEAAALCGLGPQECGPCHPHQRLDGPRALQGSVHSSQRLFIALTHNLFQGIKPASSSGIKEKGNPFGISSGKNKFNLRKQKLFSLKQLRPYEFWEGTTIVHLCHCMQTEKR